MLLLLCLNKQNSFGVNQHILQIHKERKMKSIVYPAGFEQTTTTCIVYDNHFPHLIKDYLYIIYY
jgi:uncharacterized membrane protein YoaT (DUF817 family)